MHRRPLLPIAVLSAAWVAAPASPAAADPPAPEAAPADPPPPVRATGYAFGSYGGEIALGAVSLGSLAFAALPQRTTGWAPDAARPFNQTADELSYLTFGAAMTLGVGSYVLTGEGLRHAGVPTAYLRALPVLLADVEAVALAEGVTELIKKEAGRCRPFAWTGTRCMSGSSDDYAAFPSGHTVGPSALAGVHLVELVRHPDTVSWFSFVGIELAANATAVLRVGAGAHSPTDVLAAHALGHLLGALVALAHRPVELQRGVWTMVGFDGRELTMSGVF